VEKQKELFSLEENPAAAQCADKLIDLYDEEKELKEKLEKQEIHMGEIMKELGKKKVSHKGHFIELQYIDAKEKIKVTGVKIKVNTQSIAHDNKRKISKN
jgi:hypothetical protein